MRALLRFARRATLEAKRSGVAGVGDIENLLLHFVSPEVLADRQQAVTLQRIERTTALVDGLETTISALELSKLESVARVTRQALGLLEHPLRLRWADQRRGTQHVPGPPSAQEVRADPGPPGPAAGVPGLPQAGPAAR